ncbi:MAG TPA: energy transducer TonB [Candidatus Limnocylindrales bacterium]|nr:energy transducer TonB [Candidatus Limnocylindrales bacterium]
MFDQLVESTDKKKTHKVWSVWLSALIQGAILGVLILIPLIYTSALPKALLTTFLVAPPPPPPPPPPAVKEIVKPEPKFIQQGKLLAPTVIPKKIQMIKEQPQPDVGMTGGVLGGVPGGSAGGVLGGIIGGAPGGLPPPPKPVEITRVGGQVEEANLIHKVTPEYPQIARTAHISGTVVLHAIIAKDGTVQELQFISGPPLLMRAAMDAVKQWRYRPTLLNGQAVKVDTTVTVIFSLGD